MSLGQELAPHLPFLRRFARALTGTQDQGDQLVKATLQSIVAAPAAFPRNIDPRLSLYAAFLKAWDAAPAAEKSGTTGPESTEAIAMLRLAKVTPRSRLALLLTAMEGFTAEDAGFLMGCDRSEIDLMVSEALEEIERQTRADVLIIEDEPLIAMDLESLVRDLGHDVSAIATTRTEALAAVKANRPTLVLADIQLADDSSGIDAVKDILAEFPVPVIFITAFPERLLTGDRPEPAFLITKPFQRSSVKAAISQALFFDTTTVPA